VNLIAVVLNWNGGDDTLAALRSLEGVETICVDNGSADGSDLAIAEQLRPSSCCARARTSASPAATTSASAAPSSVGPTGCCS
jgi:hypothetical protein